MKFSVVMPLFNKAPYVAKAIQSVLDQLFSDYELIIVDDGSSDGSAEIAEQAIAGHSHCRLMRQENAGVSVARNNGAAASQGDCLCFLDADDWWDPHFLEEMDQLMEELPDAGIYGSGYTIVNETRHKTRVAPIGVETGFEKGYINYCQTYAKTMVMPLTSISVAIPKPVFDEAEGFPEGVRLGEDFLLWIRIASNYKVAFLNKPLAFYNQDVDALSRGTHKQQYDPDTFMTFFFDRFEKEEKENHDLKVLLDRMRVLTLLSFRRNNLYPDRVNHEIAKVDFSNVKPIYKLFYHAPGWMVRLYLGGVEWLSRMKQKLLK